MPDQQPNDTSLVDTQFTNSDAPDQTGRLLFGMSAGQRFVLALMLFLNVTILGLLCLLVTGRIDMPIP